MDVGRITRIAVAAKPAYPARQRVNITGDRELCYMRAWSSTTAGAHS